ncbi:MAG TPA: hypothetical protein EYQ63_29805 [Fuerstia sp.]|nr:hypothetical protein [Fuerstiella sp.]
MYLLSLASRLDVTGEPQPSRSAMITCCPHRHPRAAAPRFAQLPTLAALTAVTALALFSGCAELTTDTFAVSEFTTWSIPADGRRIPAPRALYADENDTVYALDDAGRVLVYSSTGEVLKTWHMPDYEAGRPEGVIKLLDGRIAVADTHYHRVVFFHPDGTVESMLGEKGVDAGQFVYPVSIAQDPSGFIYVGEYGDRQRIQKFKADGTYITQFGEHGTGPGQFQRPSGIVWSNGTIYAVDAFNNRIQVFSDSGEFLRIVELSDNFEPFEFPYDVRGTADGRLYVIENKAARLTVLKEDGTVLGRYGHPSRGLDGFFNPWSLTVLSDGRVLVADTGNHRIVELTVGK